MKQHEQQIGRPGKMLIFFGDNNFSKLNSYKRYIWGLIAMIFASAGMAAPADELKIGSPDLSQAEQVSSLKNFQPNPNEFRIYFIGDSITRHGFNKTIIEQLKWDHVAGMAASSESKDFSHLVANRIQQLLPDKKVKLFFGKGGDSLHALTGIPDACEYRPALVIVQLGEHVNADEKTSKTAADYAALLDALKALPEMPVIICTGVWSPALTSGKYLGHTAEVEKIQRETSARKGAAFVSVEKYAVNPACSGTGGSFGVKWHPNDAGHAGYAEAIIAAFTRIYFQNHK